MSDSTSRKSKIQNELASLLNEDRRLAGLIDEDADVIRLTRELYARRRLLSDEIHEKRLGLGHKFTVLNAELETLEGTAK